MSIFGAIASAANSFSWLPPALQRLDFQTDTTPRPLPLLESVPSEAPVADPACVDPTPDTATEPAASPTLRLGRPLSGALRTQVGEIAARQGAAAVREYVLTDVGTLFKADATHPDLGTAFDGFVRAWQSVAADPTDPASQQALINHGETLVGVVRTVSDGVEALAGRLTEVAGAGVADLNQTLSAIHHSNRAIVTQAALNRPSDEAEAAREQMVAKVVEWTGANVFPRENNAIALFTPGGQTLLDDRPTRFASAAAGPVPAGAVAAEGRIVDGRLGATLQMIADGSRHNPPQRASADTTSEIVRKLRSQLDAVAGTLLGRSRPKQPTAFADAYDSIRPNADGQQISGFFVGSHRLNLAVNPDLLNGSRTVKTSAALAATDALIAGGRQFLTDGLAVAGNAGGLADTVTQLWSQGAEAAKRDAKVADAASALMARHVQGSATAINLQAEVGKLQTLQTAQGTTTQVSHALGSFLSVLDAIAA